MKKLMNFEILYIKIYKDKKFIMKCIMKYTYLGFFSYFVLLVMGLGYDVAECNFLETNDMQIL